MNTLQRIVWLASFPKSGNTWARSFLANSFQPPGKALDINSLRQFTTADVRQDFFDRANSGPFRGQTIEEWIKVRPAALRLIAASKDGHHFVKTHCQVIKVGNVPLIMPEVTAAAVYLIRNPFDLALSYARHLGLDVDAAIGRMANPQTAHRGDTGIIEFIGRWDDHIRTWTEAKGLPLHLMRYEDMVADPAAAYRGLFAFLKVPVDEAQFARTLELTSFEALRKQEQERGVRERPAQMAQFFARGTAGGWREELSAKQVRLLREAFRPTLEKWYPEMLDETRRIVQGSGTRASK
jgi:hypothetical protein